MPNFMVYIVKPGDTLGDIALRTNTNVAALTQLNGLRDPDRIYPGQRLRIPAPPPPPREDIYVVQPGDTLGDIAFRFGTTVPVLLRLNRLDDPDRLSVGQKLRIPAPPPAQTPPPMPGGRWYEVQPGDTLYSIAQELDTTVDDLIRLNDIRTPNLIYPGERLRIN